MIYALVFEYILLYRPMLYIIQLVDILVGPLMGFCTVWKSVPPTVNALHNLTATGATYWRLNYLLLQGWL